MNELIGKFTSIINNAIPVALELLAAVAVCAIVYQAIKFSCTSDDNVKHEHLKKILMILGFAIIAAFAWPLVNWALAA